MPKAMNLSGQRFGRLTAIDVNLDIPRGKGVYWICECDCGNTITVRAADLRCGNTKSCGCYRTDRVVETCTKHGMTHSRLYNIWASMNQRCRDSKDKYFADYGGRGITVIIRSLPSEAFHKKRG